MYKWEDFLNKLANAKTVSPTHISIIKQKFLEILKTEYNNLVPVDCRIVLSKINPNDVKSRNSLFVSIGGKARTSSETDVPLNVENELNNYFQKSDIAYIYNSDIEPFMISIPASEIPTKGIARQRHVE